MADGMLALSWNNHSTTFCHMLSQIRQKDRYTDATVACEGKFYPVHRIVLSTCSKYFEDMFEMTSAGKHPIVLLQDVRKYELEALLSYMYAGVVSVAQKDLARLIKIAELLQIKGLAVPDELPSEKKSASSHSERTSGGHHKSSHSLDSSEGRTSPSRKRRRREERGSSPQSLPPPSASRTQYNQDDDDILEIKSEVESNPEQLGLGPLNDSSCGVPNVEGGGGVADSRQVSSVERVSDHRSPQDPPRRGEKDGTDEMVWVKEEVLDDPGDQQDESVKAELGPRYGPPSSTGDESMDMPPDDQGDYSQASQSDLPHPLPDAGAEALAGPSGIHEWLSGGDMSTGLPAVDNYGGEGTPPTSDHPQSQQMVGGASSFNISVQLDESKKLQKSVYSSHGVKFHDCAFCSYSTPRKSHLLEHIRIHTGEKPYSCPHCTSRFVKKSALTCHIRTHTGERPYACPHCNFRFAKKGALDSHLRSHTGEKPYVCPVCFQGFTRRTNQRTHMLIHERENSSRDPAC